MMMMIMMYIYVWTINNKRKWITLVCGMNAKDRVSIIFGAKLIVWIDFHSREEPSSNNNIVVVVVVIMIGIRNSNNYTIDKRE